MMFTLPLVVLIGMIYYSGMNLHGLDRWIVYGGYSLLVLTIAWTGLPVLRGYRTLDHHLYRYMETRRADGRFRLWGFSSAEKP